jgi:TolA-binding protein
LGEGNETPSLYQQNKELVMSQQSNFDFNAFNELVQRKPAGLQIFLAQQLLSEALWSMEKYDNPREQEVRDLFNGIKELRARLKSDAEARK